MKRRHQRCLFKDYKKMYTRTAQVLQCLKIFEERYTLKALEELL